MSGFVRFRGASDLRQRLLYATLAGRPVRVDGIRSESPEPGLRDYEACLLQLLCAVTNGTQVEVDDTGTKLKYRPGTVVGGRNIKFDCHPSRSLGYYLEVLVPLALFAKRPVEGMQLGGVTNDETDQSVDTWRMSTIPMLRRAVGEGKGEDAAGPSGSAVVAGAFDVKVVRRGCPPGGGGLVVLSLPNVRQLRPLQWTDEGLVKRVRGVAFTARVAPQTASRLVDGARGLLNQLLPDVFVFTDHYGGEKGGASPGYGLSLVAETTTGCTMSSDGAPCDAAGGRTRGSAAELAAGRERNGTPEELGRRVAAALLEQVGRGGACDASTAPLALLLAALGPEQLSTVRLGLPLTRATVRALRLIKRFFGVTFNLRAEKESRTVFCAAVGCGHRNVALRAK